MCRMVDSPGTKITIKLNTFEDLQADGYSAGTSLGHYSCHFISVELSSNVRMLFYPLHWGFSGVIDFLVP